MGDDLVALRQLAVQFVLSEPRISAAVIGMKNAAEATENLSAAEAGALDAETVALLKETVKRVWNTLSYILY